MIQDDLSYVRKLLPKHYSVTQSAQQKGSIRCVSSLGIRRACTDAEDDEHWGYIMAAVKKHFGARFVEVYHSVCFCHQDFTIYLK